MCSSHTGPDPIESSFTVWPNRYLVQAFIVSYVRDDSYGSPSSPLKVRQFKPHDSLAHVVSHNLQQSCSVQTRYRRQRLQVFDRSRGLIKNLAVDAPQSKNRRCNERSSGRRGATGKRELRWKNVIQDHSFELKRKFQETPRSGAGLRLILRSSKLSLCLGLGLHGYVAVPGQECQNNGVNSHSLRKAIGCVI